MFKEFKLPKNSFMGAWFIPKKICDNLIKYFNTNIDYTTEGTVIHENKRVVKKDVKESRDFLINADINNNPEILEYQNNLQKILMLYLEKYPQLQGYNYFSLDNYNIQKYPKNGGFKKWHCERSSAGSANRVLTFMTYLNNIKNGGTEFLYQKLKIPSIKGLTLIWPVDWTHTHKGIISNKEKIITTGWYVFK
jgi:hypothetical protein